MSIAHVYIFPNRMSVVFDDQGNQIPELQGEYSKVLHQKILDASDEATIWSMDTKTALVIGLLLPGIWDLK